MSMFDSKDPEYIEHNYIQYRVNTLKAYIKGEDTLDNAVFALNCLIEEYKLTPYIIAVRYQIKLIDVSKVFMKLRGVDAM